MRNIKYIVVHCTANKVNATVAKIKKYWKEQLKWTNPGYHYLIALDGTIHHIHPEENIANGVAGHNQESIHVSYIGGINDAGKADDTRSQEQKNALLHILKDLKKRYPTAIIQGHRDFSKDKNGNGKIDEWEFIKYCPCFNAKDEYQCIK